MKKISNLLMMALLTVGMGLTSCDEQLDNAVTPYTPGVTPTVEDIIKYGFKVTDLTGVDLTGDVTSLKMSNEDGSEVVEAEVSGGKITIKNTDLTAASFTAAIDFWFEATVGTRKYVAKVNIDPTTLSPETDKTLEMATIGDVILSDGKFAKAGTTSPVAMIAYLGNSDCTHGLAIQLNDNPESKNWAEANAYTSYPTLPAGTGTWRLPSKEDWQNMFVGCAESGDATVPDADGKMDPIAGFKAKIVANGVNLGSCGCWSSTESSDSKAWRVYVGLGLDDPSARFIKDNTSTPYYVLGCLAF